MKQYFNLAEFFYDVASNHGQKNAILYRDKTISYSQLNSLSNKLANYFLSTGLGVNDVVAIINTKDAIGYAAMLACLKIGAIYTNIDEENPPQRLKKILVSCQPSLVVSDHKVRDDIVDVVNSLGHTLIDLKSDQSYSEMGDDNLLISKRIVGSFPAYIMFTSGSTGVPKGVLVSHANIISFLGWSIERYGVTEDDVFAQLSPIYFDNSVFDFYTALFSGASLAPISKSISKKPLDLIELIEELECTIWFSVPSLFVYLLSMRVLTKERLKSIRVFTFGGEGFPKGELKKLFDLYGDGADLINVYGPTEGTCICSSYKICVEDFMNMGVLAPLGEINPNFNYIIIDDNNNEVESGEKGELCLIGPNVAVGYYGDEEKTKNVFIQNPLVSTYKDIIYKTGDIVYEHDGLLWFSGRIDNQVKHMGYRIELEEIEAALNSLSYVKQSAVIYKRVSINYGKILAFISSDNDVTENLVKEDLHNLLPPYMLPNIVEVRKELLKNANGKVDKKTLSNERLA